MPETMMAGIRYLKKKLHAGSVAKIGHWKLLWAIIIKNYKGEE